MPNNWKKYKLGEIIELKRGYDLPEYSRINGDVPVYTSSGLNSFHNAAKVNGPGVITGRYGTLGEFYYSEYDFWPHNTTLYVRNFNNNNPKFIYYFLKTLRFSHSNDKSGVPGLNRNDLHTIETEIPDIPTQTQIASILSSLDDKIELNLQMNQTLEAMAQAIFKEWFVNLNFPGFDGELVEGLPKGWRKEPIDASIEFLNGLALQKFPPESETDYLPVIKIRELRQGITNASDKASTKISRKYVIEDGDVLFSWSGSLDVVLWCEGKGALNQHLFKVSSDAYPKWFYYFWTKHYLSFYQSIAEGKATTMGHIQRKHLTETIINVPDTLTLKDSNNIISPILDRIIENKVQIRTLTQLRDSLLPKLMTGKIEVKN